MIAFFVLGAGAAFAALAALAGYAAVLVFVEIHDRWGWE
jgi:hypothetical protein